MRITAALILLLTACGGEPPVDPSMTPEGRLCGRAYGSTADSIKEAFTQQGRDAPTLPEKADYIAKCLEAGFSEEQVKCLDPKLRSLDKEACETALSTVKPQFDGLEKMFGDAIAGKTADGAAPDGDKPAADAPTEDTPKVVEQPSDNADADAVRKALGQ